jgi:hypothetical protein
MAEVIATLESLVGLWQDLVYIEVLAIFISNNKVPSRWRKSDKRYILKEWRGNLSE